MTDPKKRRTINRPIVTPEIDDATQTAPPSVRPSSIPSPTEETSPDPAGNRGGIGCWLTGGVTLLVASLLIAVGLLLPPIDLYSRLIAAPPTPAPALARLQPGANAIRVDALTIALSGDDFTDDFGVAAEAIATDSADSAALIAALPPGRAFASDLYALTTSGAPPSGLTAALTVAPDYDLIDIDLFGFDPARGGWVFLPATSVDRQLVTLLDERALPSHLALLSAPAATARGVVISIGVREVLTPAAADLATIVTPAGLQPLVNGRLSGALAPGFARDAGYLVLPAIRNYADPQALDVTTIDAILRSSPIREEHAIQIAGFVAQGYDGVVIDYRGLRDDLRAPFSAFITDLGSRLRAQGSRLIVVVPAAVSTPDGWQTGAYDWAAIGAAADHVQIVLPLDPQAYAPGADRTIMAMLGYAIRIIDRDKLLAGISALSARQTIDGVAPITVDQAFSALGNVVLDAARAEGGTIAPGTVIRAALGGLPARFGITPTMPQPYLDYLDGNGDALSRVWLTTPGALVYRMTVTTSVLSLGGVAIDDLNHPGIASGILDAVFDYTLGVQSDFATPDYALRWTIADADGVRDQVVTDIDTPLLAATIDAPDGNYAINLEVLRDGEVESQRAGAAVAVFAPSPTLTPSPTPTPTPTNTPLPQAAPPSGGGQPAVAPAAGSIRIGDFEYGGHVTVSDTGAVGAMQRAGMRWMKMQLRYTPGTSPEIAAVHIRNAQSRGFKILLGLVGYPNDIAAGGIDYVRGFAEFVGGVAALGPDAVEVWNEPNLDREWPSGQISAADYTTMLRLSYEAVKRRNPSVQVISGAPAPTGAEGAFPGRVVNDDRFLREMVTAGALDYADCVGIHYNEGIVPPSARSGDPRDSFYSRYFFSMLDTYWGIIGGRKPLCFTELGYLTPEGFPLLDPYFSWAQNVTLSQQAAWLAEAVALASQSGRVRLVIIWNVDFTNYGSDPMAGYAIVRPGGACPACDSLAAAR